MRFPVPFAGITKMLVCETDAQYHALTLALSTCHPHNIALEPEKRQIYVSEAGAECAAKWYGQQR